MRVSSGFMLVSLFSGEGDCSGLTGSMRGAFSSCAEFVFPGSEDTSEEGVFSIAGLVLGLAGSAMR